MLVIGHNVAEALFGALGGSATGREVRLAGRPFTVVGVLEKRKGGFMGENEDDNIVFMPYRTGRIVAPRASDWLLLVMRARSGELPAALDQAEDVLRRRRGVRSNQPSNFDLSTADRIIQQFDGITAAIGLIAIAISGVSLLVGGIGVMNIMLVSVTERTQEIGVRKALGARRRDIVRQFLFEAIALTLSGGVIGVLLAVAVSRLLLWLLPALPSQIPPWAVVAGLAVSIGVGLVVRRLAGPSRRRARPGRGAALRVRRRLRRDGRPRARARRRDRGDDRGEVRRVEPQRRGREPPVHLLRAARTDDRAGHARPRERPGHRHRGRRDAVLRRDRPQGVAQRQVLLELRRLVVRREAAPVVGGERRRRARR